MSHRDLTTAEAAERARVTPMTMYRWCKDGKIPGAYRTLGGHWRIPADILDDVLGGAA